MADQDQNNVDDNQDEDPQVTIKGLRKQADKATELETQLANERRENAFFRAGVDVDKPLAKAIISQYTGEIDGTAIKTYLDELQAGDAILRQATPVTPVGDQQQQGDTTTDDGSTDERRNLQQGGAPPSDDSTVIDPIAKGKSEFDKALKGGESRDMAAGAFLAELFDAAARGDRRVLVEKE